MGNYFHTVVLFPLLIRLGKKVGSSVSGDYLMDHSTFTYFTNPKGKLALMFRHETNPDIMAKAIADEIHGRS